MSFRKSAFTVWIVAFLCAGPLCALTIRDVSLKEFTNSQMTSLGEYLGGGEHYGRRTYLRTDVSGRAGLYLIVDFDKPLSGLPEGSVLVLDLIDNSDGEYEQIRLPFSAAVGKMGRALYIGLTDTAHEDVELLAWRVSVCGPDGAELASSESFLWTMPPKKATE